MIIQGGRELADRLEKQNKNMQTIIQAGKVCFGTYPVGNIQKLNSKSAHFWELTSDMKAL